MFGRRGMMLVRCALILGFSSFLCSCAKKDRYHAGIMSGIYMVGYVEYPYQGHPGADFAVVMPADENEGVELVRWGKLKHGGQTPTFYAECSDRPERLEDLAQRHQKVIVIAGLRKENEEVPEIVLLGITSIDGSR